MSNFLKNTGNTISLYSLARVEASAQLEFLARVKRPCIKSGQIKADRHLLHSRYYCRHATLLQTNKWSREAWRDTPNNGCEGG